MATGFRLNGEFLAFSSFNMSGLTATQEEYSGLPFTRQGITANNTTGIFEINPSGICIGPQLFFSTTLSSVPAAYGNALANVTGNLFWQTGNVWFQVANKSYVDTVPSWTTPTMLNSWTTYHPAHPSPQYTKTHEGIVIIKGVIKNGTITSACFTLPSGYRPAKQHVFTTSSNTGLSRVDVYGDGNVVPQSGGNAWFVIDLMFKAEQ